MILNWSIILPAILGTGNPKHVIVYSNSKLKIKKIWNFTHISIQNVCYIKISYHLSSDNFSNSKFQNLTPLKIKAHFENPAKYSRTNIPTKCFPLFVWDWLDF